MGHLKKLALFISAIILSIFIISCNSSSDTAEKAKEDSKEEQIKKSFAKTLDMYPIKNLEVIEMTNLKKAIRVHGLYSQVLLKVTNQAR